MDQRVYHKGVRHFERYAKMGMSYFEMLELVYQDGRIDALMEVYSRLSEEKKTHGETRGVVDSKIEEIR